MKLLSSKARKRSIRLTRKRTWRRLKRVDKLFVSPIYEARIDRNVIKAPRRVNIVRGAEIELVAFLTEIKSHVLTANERLTLDFRETVSFAPAGTLLLLAELDRVVQLSTLPKPLTCIAPRSRRTKEVMKQIGLFAITKDSVDVVPQRHDVVYWRATKGANQDGNVAGPLIEHVASTVNKVHAMKIEESGIWPGVSEAINNVTDHAYKGERADGFQHASDTKWWMFTHVKDDVFYAAICDLGIGYRRTVPMTIPESFQTMIASLLMGKNPDSRAIETAMKYGVSSTKQENRGKGSRDALAVLKSHRQGELLVASNTGWVHYKLKKGATEPDVSSYSLKVDIMGTIVWWRLPLGDLL